MSSSKKHPKKLSVCSIAKALDVSASTVSRSLRGDVSISGETRSRVAKYAESHGYKPNRQRAQFFKGIHKSTSTVGFYAEARVHSYLERNDLFYFRILMSAQVATGHRKMHLMLLNLDKDAICSGGFYSLEEGLVDCVVAKVTNEAAVRALSSQAPTVILDYRPRTPNVDSVIVDLRRAAAAQIEHLSALGHRHIAIFRPHGVSNGQPFRDIAHDVFIREAQTYANERGVTLHAASQAVHTMVAGGESQSVADFLDMCNLRGSHMSTSHPVSPVPTALLIHDTYGGDFVAELEARGLSVPGDISLVGYDDETHGRPCAIPLTTFRQNYDEMLKQALDLVTSRTENPSLPARFLQVEGQMVVRDSTAPVPAAQIRSTLPQPASICS